MLPQREFDADQLAQDVVNAWGTVMQGGNGKALSADFKDLFEKACAYRTAKEVADNHREHNMLTVAEEEREQITRKEFLDAYLPVARMAMEWCAQRV
jgi:hypothetical protein